MRDFEATWKRFAGLKSIQLEKTSKRYGCRVYKTVLPWKVSRPELEGMSEEELRKGAEGMEVMMLGGMKGCEVYVQWIKN